MNLDAIVGIGAAAASVVFMWLLGRAEKQMDYNVRRRRARGLDKAQVIVMRKR